MQRCPYCADAPEDSECRKCGTPACRTCATWQWCCYDRDGNGRGEGYPRELEVERPVRTTLSSGAAAVLELACQWWRHHRGKPWAPKAGTIDFELILELKRHGLFAKNTARYGHHRPGPKIKLDNEKTDQEAQMGLLER